MKTLADLQAAMRTLRDYLNPNQLQAMAEEWREAQSDGDGVSEIDIQLMLLRQTAEDFLFEDHGETPRYH